jgi:hypothetical protein
MQEKEKHKVTLYLPQELHRQLKIRSAVESEAMSAIAERAIVFYLTHPALVDEVETSQGRVHQIHECPSCSTSMIMRDGKMVPLGKQPGVLTEEELAVGQVHGSHPDSDSPSDEQALVIC